MLARTADGWAGHEVDLDEVEDLEALVDLMRDAGEDDEPILVLVEEDDEYVGIVRVDGDADPRVFISDARASEHSAVAALLWERVAAEVEEEGDEEVARPEAEPAGDADLLADLGTPGEQLLELCAEEGMLPADVIGAVCERAGCLDALESLR
jgi:putative tRNA adenosine deaminase-associated protein